MAANLGPDYLAAEQEFRQAATPAEKIAALERMWATLPKHKGTEKLQADLKKKLGQARRETQKKGAGHHAAPIFVVPREGAAQVALIGPPNSGKSSLVRALTHARPEVGDYPFTTRVPTPGMMPYEDVQIQLVDLPPVSPDHTEPWLSQAIRRADTGLLVVDPNDPASLDEIEYVERRLDEWQVARPRLLIATKLDQAGAADNDAALAELYGDRYRTVAVSSATGENLDRFAREVFCLLELVRVYTKAPGKKPDLAAPYVVRRGQSVVDVARLVHQDFAAHLKYARLFRLAGDRDGLMVDRDHRVEDRDILEFHA